MAAPFLLYCARDIQIYSGRGTVRFYMSFLAGFVGLVPIVIASTNAFGSDTLAIALLPMLGFAAYEAIQSINDAMFGPFAFWPALRYYLKWFPLVDILTALTLAFAVPRIFQLAALGHSASFILLLVFLPCVAARNFLKSWFAIYGSEEGRWRKYWQYETSRLGALISVACITALTEAGLDKVLPVVTSFGVDLQSCLIALAALLIAWFFVSIIPPSDGV